MLDSERTFKIKVRSCWTSFEILLGKETVQNLQNHKRHKVDQGHSKKLS